MKLTRSIIAISLSLSAAAAQARDTVLHIPLADVLAMPEAQQKLSGKVKFFLAGSNAPKVLQTLGGDTTNQKTNGVGKSDEFGCKWVILSGLIAFEKKALAQGANAVVDIVSYYKKNETKSAETIECHAGAVIIGAAMKASYAKIES